MLKKRSNFALLLLALLMLVGSLAIPSQSQSQPPSWETVSKNLLAYTALYKTIDMTFRRETFNSELVKTQFAAKRNEHSTQSNETLGTLRQNPSNSTPNGVFSYHWYADKVRWLCERTGLYPKDQNRFLTDWARYNGEQLYIYDDFTQHGEVKASDSVPGAFFGSIRTNPHLFLDYIENLCDFRKDEVSISFHKKEVIDGQECLTYVGKSKQTAPGKGWLSYITVSICPSKNFALVRLIDETFISDANDMKTHNGSGMVYHAESFKRDPDGFFVPYKSKLESYRLYQDRMKWRNTDVYLIDKIQKNLRLSDGIFSRDFPPGIKVFNPLTSPGTAVFVGGDWGDSVTRVAGDLQPKQDIPDGTKIEISSFVSTDNTNTR